MSDWMIRSIVAGTITAARGGFKNPRGARTAQSSRETVTVREDALIDGAHSGRRGLTVWCGGPRAPHHLHSNGLLDAVSLLRERSQSGPLEVLHQSQVPRPHAHRGILGRHPCLHAAVGAGLFCWSGSGRHRVQASAEQTRAHRRNRSASVWISGALGSGDLHRHDRQLLRQALHRLEVLVVLYSGMDRHRTGSGSRSSAALCLSEKRL